MNNRRRFQLAGICLFLALAWWLFHSFSVDAIDEDLPSHRPTYYEDHTEEDQDDTFIVAPPNSVSPFSTPSSSANPASTGTTSPDLLPNVTSAFVVSFSTPTTLSTSVLPSMETTLTSPSNLATSSSIQSSSDQVYQSTSTPSIVDMVGLSTSKISWSTLSSVATAQPLSNLKQHMSIEKDHLSSHLVSATILSQPMPMPGSTTT
ncbi:hypothetical protein B0J11DRAFT_113048 [Dendryphion nanum]|uniref:Uncharacterized protein n=1 Tax=Dendryphion nanum TaxID=256645 RepID=A0A9P9IDW4_9PLEO|nr:hypothetical protein B0J11DRAFT_113048 [Dendryphion nanum]